MLPITMVLDQTSAIILLAGIYYGSQYGGSITSVLMRVPRRSPCLTVIPWPNRAEPGAALGISIWKRRRHFRDSAIAIIGPAFTKVALAFGPVEKSSIVLLGLVLWQALARGRVSAARGRWWRSVWLLSTVGVDLISGAERFTFSVSYLRDGFNIAILAMGLFGMSEVSMLIQQKEAHEATRMPSYRLRDLLPNRKDWKASGRTDCMWYGSRLFPGAFAGRRCARRRLASYLMEKKLPRSPERSGKGAIEGVAGPESANAAAQAVNYSHASLLHPSNAW